MALVARQRKLVHQQMVEVEQSSKHDDSLKVELELKETSISYRSKVSNLSVQNNITRTRIHRDLMTNGRRTRSTVRHCNSKLRGEFSMTNRTAV